MPGSKRANREGTYEQLKSGKWRVYTRIDGKKVSGKAMPTRKEAAESFRKALALHDASASGLPSASSWSTFAREWSEGRVKRLSPTTAETERYWLRYIDKDPLGKKPVKAITERDLKAFPDRLGIARTSARNVCAWCNQILAAANCPHRIPVPPKAQHTRRPLSPGERDAMRTLLSRLDEETRTCAILCWLLGLRRSEACGLRHDDRDGDGVWIRRVVVIADGKFILRQKTKTPKGSGWVPIPPVLRDLVGPPRSGYVTSGGSTPSNPKALSQRLDEALRGDDLRNVPFLGMHALRRTYGMMQLEAGAEAVTVADSMRHDVQMLLNEYARSRHDLKTEASANAFKSFVLPRALPHKEPD